MPDSDRPRLIEVAFPLKQASLDSVHEKMCHSGHIKSLHIYPARRPLAACRAALIATLLPDPGTPEKRNELLEKIGGKVVTEIKKKKVGGKTVEVLKARTVGGVLHWGNENSPDMDCFREEIKKAYGGRAPRVLDPFAGGGAIPLEAMRLGCEATAIDINAVAWFILKCTLEYPQQLAGQVRPLPKFAVESPEFMEAFLKGSGKLGKKQVEKELAQYQQGLFPPPEADLAWHVRAWGWWVLQEAGKELDQFYPAIDGRRTLAYLWARTTKCIKCRATVPLLKSLWLRKKGSKRVLLTVSKASDRTGVCFGIKSDVPSGGGNVAQQRDHDKSIGKGTMSRSGATCPCCGAIIPTEDIRLEGQAGHLGSVMTAVVVESQSGKEFRLPTETDLNYNATIDDAIVHIFDDIPCGCPNEPVPQGASRVSGGSPFTIFIYGMTKWSDLYTKRQLVVIGSFLRVIRRCWHMLAEEGYNPEWCNAIIVYLCCVLNKVCDYNSSLVAWQKAGAKGANTFQRWALPFKWDFTENNVITSDSGGWAAVCDWVTKPLIDFLPRATSCATKAKVQQENSTKLQGSRYDLILTDPPYYDAIAYADLMDFFYVWLSSSFHEKLYNRGSGHTTPVAPADPLRHRAFLASAPAAGAPLDAR